jgi:hypothetical protein
MLLTCTASSAGGAGSASVTIKRDATAPSTSGNVISATTQATITLAASDALSGVSSTSYRLNGGATQLYRGPITLSNPGSYTISYFSADRAGNLEASQTLTVTVNAAPSAVDDSYTTNQDTALTVVAPGVLSNDTDLDAGDTRTAALLSGPSHAAAFALNVDGSFSYTPAAGFNGADIFSYQARDSHGALSAPATVTISIMSPNGPPTTGPNVSLEQAAGQADPASSSPVHFTVVFSEPVNGFSNQDVTLGGTAGASSAVVTEIGSHNGTTYDVAVSGMRRSGTVQASVAANVAQDAASNGNRASTSADNTVTFVTGGTQPPHYQVHVPLVRR